MRILAISCLVLLSFSAWTDTVKIGYIDTQKVINNLPQYQQSVGQISEEFEPKKLELLSLFKHIELLRAKVNAINNTEKKENLQIELSKLTLLEESFKKETEYWQETMNTKKIELLLYENAAFVSDEVNITNKVIQRILNNSL
jgi:Skp family chaperone for outer membrane proteins